MVSKREKACIIEFLKDRYRRSRKKQKGEIITEVCERFSVGRKQAIRLLRPKDSGRPRKPGKAGRPRKYEGYEFKQGLRLFWRLMRYACSRTVKSGIPLWMDAVEAEYGYFDKDTKRLLLSVSASTIDRILKPYKVTKGPSLTRSGGFRDEIPIQGNIWDVNTPGYMECDTAALCGGSLSGEFTNTLTMVDIATLWTETRAVFGKGSNAVFDAIRDVEHNLPFAILGYDADNGGEVLNRHLFDYFYTERINKGLPPVEVTRSRAYKKNDNAHIEQRNDSMVRKFLGYERMDFREIIPLLNHYYGNIVCPMINHFMPSFKLKEKRRIKIRTRRIYDDPVTPYQRLMESSYLSEMQKLKLQTVHRALNPVTLAKEEKKIRTLIDTCLKRLRAGQEMPDRVPAYELWMPLIPNNPSSRSARPKRRYVRDSHDELSTVGRSA